MSTQWANKGRFGLFSYIPFSVGENTYTKDVERKRDEDGFVPVKPR